MEKKREEKKENVSLILIVILMADLLYIPWTFCLTLAVVVTLLEKNDVSRLEEEMSEN